MPEPLKTEPPAADRTRHFGTDHLQANLVGRSVRGGAITMASQALRFVLSMGSTVVLARLLTPKDYGLFGMVAAVTGFVIMFKDLGLSQATVQREDITHEQISTLFWVNVALSTAALAVAAALAPAIAWFYHEPRLTAMTFGIAAAFIFSGLSVQHQALLQRQMRFGALAVIDITALVTAIAVSIVMACRGAHYWALVANQIVFAGVTAIGLWTLCRWRPGLPMRRAGVRTMLAFGGHLTGFNVLNYIARNADNLLIGRVWGPMQLGLYAKAYQLLLMPLQQINAPISSVAIAALCRVQTDAERYRRYYCSAVTLIAFLTTPLIVAMAALSDEIVLIVLGNQWLGASRIFKVLAIAALGQPISNMNGWLLISRGETKRMMQWGMISVPIFVAAFALGLPWGAYGVAVAYAIATQVLRIPGFLFSFHGSPIRLRNLWDAAWRPIAASFVMFAAMLGMKHALAGEKPIIVVAAASAVAIVVFAGQIILWPRARAQAGGLLDALRSLKGDAAPGDAVQTPCATDFETMDGNP